MTQYCRLGREASGAGAVDEEDFIQAFEDVPTVQVQSQRRSNLSEDFQDVSSFSFVSPPLRSTPTGRWRRP